MLNFNKILSAFSDSSAKFSLFFQSGSFLFLYVSFSPHAQHQTWQLLLLYLVLKSEAMTQSCLNSNTSVFADRSTWLLAHLLIFHSQEIQTLNLVSCCKTVQIEERESRRDCFKLEDRMFCKEEKQPCPVCTAAKVRSWLGEGG